MALFRRLLYSKRPDRPIETSDWVFVEDPSPPAPLLTAQINGASTVAASDGSAASLSSVEDQDPRSRPQAEASAIEKTVSAGLVASTPATPPAPAPPTPPKTSTLPPPRSGGGHTPDHPPHGVGGPVVRRSSLKPLNWDKVNRAVEGSLWEELQTHEQPQSATEIDVSELEELFSSMSPKKAGSKEAEKRKSSLTPEKVQLIDPLRARNTEIVLNWVKLPIPYIVDAVLAMDDTVLDADQVEQLLKCFPTKEEMEILKNYTGDQEKLGKCEQYFLELMKLPRMESKLNALMFKVQFSSQIAELKESLNTVNSACDEVRTSVKLKEIMKRILYMGNTLNQGTDRGSAVGFKLDSLLKLTDTRSSNSNKTLMHYLCMLLATKSPDLLDFHEELVSLEAATKIQLRSVAENLQALFRGLEKGKLEVDASSNDGPVSAGFLMTLKEFIDHAEQELISLNNFNSIVSKNADGLAVYFGEDPKHCTFEKAAEILHDFVLLFLKCHKENLEQAELKRKESQEDGNGIVKHTMECPSNPSLNLV